LHTLFYLPLMNIPSSFIRLAKATLVLVYLVIIAGSIVRATGSGMGCPDWPRCFGRWIPPTTVQELPADYRSYFKVQQAEIEVFNAAKTWTEYANRWVGVLLGIAMLVQLVAAFRLRKTHSLLLKLSILTLLLTGMEGVLGAIVVYTNLKTGVITLHMFLSLVILATQAMLVFKSSDKAGPLTIPPLLKRILLLGLVFTTLQILAGTQVRERVDHLMPNFDSGTRWDIPNHLGLRFLAHGYFAWTLLAFQLFTMGLIWKNKNFYGRSKKILLMLVVVLLLEIGAGATLKLCALPAWIQPIHLLLASILFGLQWALVLKAGKSKQENAA
jgi:cytochrome c oxidase assembly protein subunit 15